MEAVLVFAAVVVLFFAFLFGCRIPSAPGAPAETNPPKVEEVYYRKPEEVEATARAEGRKPFPFERGPYYRGTPLTN